MENLRLSRKLKSLKTLVYNILCFILDRHYIREYFPSTEVFSRLAQLQVLLDFDDWIRFGGAKVLS